MARRTILRTCGAALLAGLGFGLASGPPLPAFAALTITTALPSLPLPTVPVPTVSVTTVSVPTVSVPTVSVPTVSVPTVSVPTVSVPTVAAPTAPVPTVSTPSLPPPPPAPTTVRAPAAPAPSRPSASPPPPQGAASTWFPAQGTSGSGSGDGADAPVRLRSFDVSRERFANRGKHRRATVLRFRLTRASRLVLVVRGPGPSCDVAARIPIRGREGANRVRFDGRVRGRPLEPGTYLLTPRLRGHTEDLARAHVTIEAPGDAVTPRVLPRCERGDDGTAAFLAAVHAPDATPTSAAPSGESARVAGAVAPPLAGALGAEATPELALPEPGRGPDELPTIFGILLLALVPASLIGLAAAVVHYIRTPQT